MFGDKGREGWEEEEEIKKGGEKRKRGGGKEVPYSTSPSNTFLLLSIRLPSRAPARRKVTGKIK